MVSLRSEFRRGLVGIVHKVLVTECQWPLRGLGLDFPCDFLGLARLDLFLYFHDFTFVFRSRIR